MKGPRHRSGAGAESDALQPEQARAARSAKRRHIQMISAEAKRDCPSFVGASPTLHTIYVQAATDETMPESWMDRSCF
eukprot:SAG31_NODE_27245_length_429_cov_0.896970_1_plen_77_part_01